MTSETWKLDARLLAMAGGMAAFVPILVVRRYAEIFYALLVLVLLLFGMQSGAGQNVRFQQRNFFGVEKIYDDSALGLRYMMHNTTVHGVGAVDAAQPVRVTSYYHALESVAARLPLMRTAPVAAIGLGTGTVQCLAQPDQRFDYFEINPLVVRLATDPAMFRYLHECPGRHRILLGDGRITLAAQTAGKYGVILVDAFSSDAIPTHLMTREAFALYVAKLRPHGVVLLHTTNRHIDLWPLVAGQARSAQLIAYGKHFAAPSDDPALYQSSWVAVARHREDLAPLLAQDEGWNELEPLPGTRPWTDDYTNIVPYLKMLHPDRTAR